MNGLEIVGASGEASATSDAAGPAAGLPQTYARATGAKPIPSAGASAAAASSVPARYLPLAG